MQPLGSRFLRVSLQAGWALRVAFDLSVPDNLDAFSSDLQMQSVRADIAAPAALVSVIAHVIDKASK
jgi:hypothetical protein